jgi:pilus retraction protein PilT
MDDVVLDASGEPREQTGEDRRTPNHDAVTRVDDVVRAFEHRARRREEEMRARAVTVPVATVDENAPAVQVVNLILEQALRSRASDVHIEPAADRLRIRLRTDGALHDVFALPASMGQSLASRIKVMAELNIVERRRAQDGQITVTIGGHDLDIRVSTIATVHGEKIVLRLLDKARALYPLDALGMPLAAFARYHDLVVSPFGLVVCAGPTGSGKTTTLYATLAAIDRSDINVVTIEDPVEYVHHHKRSVVSQREIGWDTESFARGLRAALREDPDVVLVGEMRDPETIATALTVAETGHLVLATLHTNDAPQAVDRMIDVFPADQQAQVRVQLAASLLAVVAQRLLPAVGGGLVAAFEVMVATHPVRNLVREGKTHQLRNLVATGGRDGMRTMEASLADLVAAGRVTPDDARARALRPDEYGRPGTSGPPRGVLPVR